MHANLTTQHEIMLYYYHYLDGLFLNECWSKDRIGAVRRAFPPLHHHPTSQLQASQSPTTPFYNSACFVLHIYMCFDCCVSVCLFCVPISYNTKKSQKLHDITPHTWHRGEGGMRVEVGLYISSIIVYDHIMCCICGSFKAFRMRFTHEFFGEDLLIQ